jgi:hypothetical protein
LQAQLNVVREVFSNKKFPSMIAALKQAIAIYRNDPEWARVRPPLVELTTEQARSLREELKAIGFAMIGIRRNSSGIQEGRRRANGISKIERKVARRTSFN